MNAASPGTTVLVEPGGYAPAKVSVAGTAAAPVTISSAIKGQAAISSGTAGPAFSVSGSAYVTIDGFTVSTVGAQAAVIANSSHVTVDGLSAIEGISQPQPIIEIAGSSSYVTVSRSLFQTIDGHQAFVQIDSGSAHDVITTNVFVGFTPGVVVNGAVDTVISSNTFPETCNEAIALHGASTGASIENNAIDSVYPPESFNNCVTTTSPKTGIEVDSGATAGTTVDYNTLDTLATSALVNPYTWAGTAYASAADLNQHTGQGAHDSNADPTYSFPTYAPLGDSSPLVDSADANAPGELPTDLYGNPRVDDPNVPNTGAAATTTPSTTYYDRGAVELQDPLSVAVTLDSQTGTAPATFTATESLSAPGWSAPTIWTIDFGDGSGRQSTATPSAIQHTYTASGAYLVTVTATDSSGTASASTPVDLLSSNVYHPLSPSRVLDTRTGDGTNGVVAPVKSGAAIPVAIEGVGAIPASGVTAVAVNITVTNPTAGGYITAYADGASRPKTSNLNFPAGRTVPNMAIVPVGADGKIDLYNGSGGPADLIADVAGYYGQGSGVGLSPLGGGAVRILDTRKGVGVPTATPIARNGTLNFASSWLTGVSAVVLNVTVTRATSFGFLTVYPDGAGLPNASNLNFTAGQTVANQVVVPVTPTRLPDTRNGTGAPAAAVAPQGTVNLKTVGVASVPAHNVSAIAANITVAQPTSGGYITVYPNYQPTAPTTSTLNFAAHQTTPNLAISAIEFDGIKLLNGSAGTSQLIADVFGYYDNGLPPAN